MDELSIRTVKDHIRSCNTCNAKNYESSFPSDTGKKVDVLYELCIGHMCITMCEDCINRLKNLVNSAVEYLEAGK